MTPGRELTREWARMSRQYRLLSKAIWRTSIWRTFKPVKEKYFNRTLREEDGREVKEWR